jgi:hypothetical protein
MMTCEYCSRNFGCPFRPSRRAPESRTSTSCRPVPADGGDLRQRLTDRGVHLHLTNAARQLVARQGFDPVYGARPLKRFLQHQLESKIGRALIAGDVTEGADLTVEVKDGGLSVAIENAVGGDRQKAAATCSVAVSRLIGIRARPNSSKICRVTVCPARVTDRRLSRSLSTRTRLGERRLSPPLPIGSLLRLLRGW